MAVVVHVLSTVWGMMDGEEDVSSNGWKRLDAGLVLGCRLGWMQDCNAWIKMLDCQTAKEGYMVLERKGNVYFRVAGDVQVEKRGR